MTRNSQHSEAPQSPVPDRTPENDYSTYLAFNGLEDTRAAHEQFRSYNDDINDLNQQAAFVAAQLNRLHVISGGLNNNPLGDRWAKIAAEQARLHR